MPPERKLALAAIAILAVAGTCVAQHRAGRAAGLQTGYGPLTAPERQAAARALVDPLTQHRIAEELRNRPTQPIVPIFPFYPVTSFVVIQSPPVVVVTPAASAQPEPGVVLAAGPAAPAARAAAEVEEVPVPSGTATSAPPELEELLLVQRDGREIAVIAFAKQGERIIYVTPAGRRAVLPLAELDREATLARNEERGVVVRL